MQLKSSGRRAAAFFAVVLVAVIVPIDAAMTQAMEKRPNVLLIAIDDLNDWIGCMGGHPQAITPNIDALANRGMLFTNAHCQGPICGPSRASLLSGRYPHTTGVYQQTTGKKMEQDQLFFAGQLLPEYFAAHGYLTLGCGKITHGYSPQLAFEKFGGTFGGFGPKPEERFHYSLPDLPWSGTQTDWGRFPDVDSKMPDHNVADWAIEQLRHSYHDPIFLAVGFVRPHVPFYVPGHWFEPFDLTTIELPDIRRDDLADVPLVGRQIHEMPKYPNLDFLRAANDEQFRLAVQAYLACIRFVDHQVGRVLAALDQSSYSGDTIIVLLSDHGYHLGEKNRVSKHSLWEESTRVPLIVVPPRDQGTDFVAQTCPRPVGPIDIYPTLIEMCGLPPRSENEGQSLVSLMENPMNRGREAVLTTYARDNHSLRSERYRFIRYQDGSEELYDHQTDPQEFINLAADPKCLPTLIRMRKLLPRQSASYHAATSKKAVNAWFAKHLREQGVTD